jgi:hypothetical protein
MHGCRSLTFFRHVTQMTECCWFQVCIELLYMGAHKIELVLKVLMGIQNELIPLPAATVR